MSIINPWCACAARVTVVLRVCVCVCVCLLPLQLTLRLFVRRRNDTTYLAGNENQLNCRLFSENSPLLRSARIIVVRIQTASHFAENAHAHCPPKSVLPTAFPALCTPWKHPKLLKGHNVSQRLHSNVTYEYSYPVGARNDRLWARASLERVVVNCMCLHSSRMLVYTYSIYAPRVCTLVLFIVTWATYMYM